jgi:2-keto-4-pentenoate hydratase/2-oxohepta-3-ene-1,7-dioic acid hydratase in catechol pathway
MLGGKCFDGSCPLGPWITPASVIRDPQNLAMRLWVNDELRQDSNTSQMVFTAAEQLAMLSSRLTLQPGDVILTGAPALLEQGEPKFLEPGDRIRMWIEMIGEMTHTVV